MAQHHCQVAATYYGELIGQFANRFHGIQGEVYAVDSRTLFIKVSTDQFHKFFPKTI